MLSSFISLASRGCLATVFLWLGYHHLLSKGATIKFLMSHDVPLAGLAYVGLLAFELLGGILILLGSRARLTGFLLSLYWLAVMFPFGNLLRPLVGKVDLMIMLAVLGGLLHVAAFGGGRFSFDRP